MRDKLWRIEQDLKSKREELEQLKAEASGLRNTGPVVISSVSGLSKGASAGSSENKKMKKSKQKRHPGLPLQEKQEYYKSYLAHL